MFQQTWLITPKIAAHLYTTFRTILIVDIPYVPFQPG